MATPDGIETQDWDVVHTLAVEIVNAREPQRGEYKEQLLIFLRELEKKYGSLPSILATRADYLDSGDPAREELLLRAHVTAAGAGDVANMVYSAQSLVELFLEWRRLPEADRWLNRLREYVDRCKENVVSYFDYETLRAEYRQLVVRLADVKEAPDPSKGTLGPDQE
jgi:hypothetical protein